MRATADGRREVLQALRQRCEAETKDLATKPTQVVVAGRSKGGKSTLMNNLLGLEICPCDVDPQTEFPMIITSHNQRNFVITARGHKMDPKTKEFGSQSNYIEFVKKATQKDSRWYQEEIQHFTVEYPSSINEGQWARWKFVDLAGHYELLNSVTTSDIFDQHFHEMVCLYVVRLTEGTYRSMCEDENKKADFEQIHKYLDQTSSRKVVVILTDVEAYLRGLKNAKKASSISGILDEARDKIKKEFISPIRKYMGEVPFHFYDLNDDYHLGYNQKLELVVLDNEAAPGLAGYQSVCSLLPIRNRIFDAYDPLKQNQEDHFWYKVFLDMVSMEIPSLSPQADEQDLFDDCKKVTAYARLSVLTEFSDWITENLKNWTEETIQDLNKNDKDRNRISKPNYTAYIGNHLNRYWNTKITSLFMQMADKFVISAIKEIYEKLIAKEKFSFQELSRDQVSLQGSNVHCLSHQTEDYVLVGGLSGTVGAGAGVGVAFATVPAYTTATGATVTTASGTTITAGASSVGTAVEIAGARIVGFALGGVGIALATCLFIYKCSWYRKTAHKEVSEQFCEGIRNSQKMLRDNLNEHIDRCLREVIKYVMTERELLRGDVLGESFYEWLKTQDSLSRVQYDDLRRKASRGSRSFRNKFGLS
mmetsp:Transcript_29708/g.33788  ORF Transcript_29708/g.33788 Transcript_29708/m.33788 type:complete len:648 (-) Transcript_29708:133-2076(-)